ncbi:MAG TPA: hypothetical protein VFG83_11965 [Kofleriaceae bacterium]|nr:hypothetical protein [Kofleriaceae bacterium]
MGKGQETSLIRGTVGGVIAAMAMTGMRVVTTELGIVDQVPPEAIVAQKTPSLFALVPKRRHKVMLELLHWAYGASAGAAFGKLPRDLRAKKWMGPGYGLGVWLAFEAVLAPALGLSQASEARIAERIAFAVDHALYGTMVAAYST